MAERNLPDVPLRDVVGMLRSFDYAARCRRPARRPGRGRGAARRAGRTTAPSAPSWPATRAGPADRRPARRPLFVALWLDKALYEVVYEQRNRPDWVAVPVRTRRRRLHRQYRTGRRQSGRKPQRTGIDSRQRSARHRPDPSVAAVPSWTPDRSRCAGGPRPSRRNYHAPHSVLGAHLDDHGHVTDPHA